MLGTEWKSCYPFRQPHLWEQEGKKILRIEVIIFYLEVMEISSILLVTFICIMSVETKLLQCLIRHTGYSSGC